MSFTRTNSEQAAILSKCPKLLIPREEYEKWVLVVTVALFNCVWRVPVLANTSSHFHLMVHEPRDVVHL